MDTVIMLSIVLFLVAVVLVVVVLNIIQMIKNNRYKKIIDNLEIEKNRLDSAPIMPELSKIESLLKNEKLEVMYDDWKERFENIKNIQIPKITDMLIESEYSLSQMNYKDTLYKIAKLEMEIYKVRTNSEFLLNEIKDITNSEEKNRALITKFKVTYRDLLDKYNSDKSAYGELEKVVSLQFENISSRFDEFEDLMEKNEYTEIPKIIKSIDEMLKHMEVVISELPSIVLMATNVLPKKIAEILETYKSMTNKGYPLDYLNVEYNVEEANKKINDIIDKAKVLNLEESTLELKVLSDYFDSVFEDFEKEKVNKINYEEANSNFKERLDRTNRLVEDMFSQIDDIKNIYNLSEDDINLLTGVRLQLEELNNDYEILKSHTNNNAFAYSKIIGEVENLSNRLAKIEEKLDTSLDAIGSMKEDEVRARQQLEEVKSILKDSKSKLRDYKLPLIPQSYYVELNEAGAAIKEIVKELDKKPITISTLNTRVDTARDLVLKLYGKTKEMIRNATFAEMAIVYGNRYRSNEDDLDKSLTYSEVLFYKGDYKQSLELTINALNKVEPGVYDKLTKLYSEEK